MTRRILLALVCGAVAMGTFTVPAKASMSAVVVNGGQCALYDGDGGLVTVPDGKFSVTTPSGNRMLQCRATGLNNSTGRAVHYDSASTGGVLCNAGGTPTDDWHETVSASGNAVITCNVKH